MGMTTKGRAINLQVGPGIEAEIVGAEEVDDDVQSHIDVNSCVVMERLPVDDKIGTEDKPSFDLRRGDARVNISLEDGVHRATGHQQTRSKGKIESAGDAEIRADLPVDPDPRHDRVVVRLLKVRMVAAEGHHEVPRVWIRPKPTGEGEAAGQMTIRIENVGIFGQLSLHDREALIGNERSSDLQ